MNTDIEITDTLTAVFEHIDANRDKHLRRVMDYVRHPSISAHDIGIREVAAMLVDHLSGLGFETEAVPTSGHPMVLGNRCETPRQTNCFALRSLRCAAARSFRTVGQPAVRANDP